METVEVKFVEIENVGKVKLDLKKVPFKKYRNAKALMKDPDTSFEGVVAMLQWAVKENGSPAFSEEYLDELDMDAIEVLFDKLTDKVNNALDESKKN